jgi:preprotein translocase SecE subunit
MVNGTQTIEKSKWLQPYKPSQGYWTRVMTAVGGGAFVLWGGSWIFDKLSVYGNLYAQVAGAVIFILLLGILLFWLVGKKPMTVDFLVSVEGEMKKVNWSSKSEVIGSTKVVIVFVLMFGLLLTVVDTLFMGFFSWIGVLKGPGIGDLFGDLFSGIAHWFSK